MATFWTTPCTQEMEILPHTLMAHVRTNGWAKVAVFPESSTVGTGVLSNAVVMVGLRTENKHGQSSQQAKAFYALLCLLLPEPWCQRRLVKNSHHSPRPIAKVSRMHCSASTICLEVTLVVKTLGTCPCHPFIYLGCCQPSADWVWDAISRCKGQ